MKIQLNNDENYAARFVILNDFEVIPNADCIKVAKVNNYSVIVGADIQPGTRGVYFPVGCQINKEFLFKNNLFSNAATNEDQKTKGYFDKHGRVKPLLLRGVRSEGVFMPLSSFHYFVNISDWDKVEENTAFDTIYDVEICKKYIIIPQAQGTPSAGKRVKVKKDARVIPGQFAFHYSTPRLAENAHMINPEDIIIASVKLHGSSVISSRVLVNRKLSIWEKVKKLLRFPVVTQEYDYLWASRTVLKSEYESSHYYKQDIWKAAHEKVKHALEDKLTFYGEIVGWTGPGGGMIQKGYDYMCQPGELEVYIYRITTTEPDGTVREWPMMEVVEFCNNKGIKHVPITYHGPAKDWFPELSLENHWNQEFVEKIKNLPPMEQKCPYCKNDVLFEGWVIRNEKNTAALKVKAFAFSVRESKELDAGEVDIESAESIKTEE